MCETLLSIIAFVNLQSFSHFKSTKEILFFDNLIQETRQVSKT